MMTAFQMLYGSTEADWPDLTAKEKDLRLARLSVPEDQWPLAKRLLDSGFDWNGDFFTRRHSSAVRTARKDHPGIKAGERYIERTTLQVFDDGSRRFDRRRERMEQPANIKEQSC